MLTEKYINALFSLKAQSEGSLNDVKRLAQGCDAEAGHIYRIIHAHNTNIDEINEELLEHYMAEEVRSGTPYPCPDRDSLQFVDQDKDVTVYPSVMRGNVSYHIENQSSVLLAHEAKEMLSNLAVMGRLSMITETIQSLYQMDDGTQLQTAFPELGEVKDCIQAGLNLPNKFLKKLKEWESLGATEVNFDFVEING